MCGVQVFLILADVRAAEDLGCMTSGAARLDKMAPMHDQITWIAACAARRLTVAERAFPV
jgi:hypothetical protein